MLRFSPSLMFLKNARSVLRIDGLRRAFRGRLPICPRAVGCAKQLVLNATGVPSAFDPLKPLVGSQTTHGSALIWPPVQSVMGLQRSVNGSPVLDGVTGVLTVA